MNDPNKLYYTVGWVVSIDKTDSTVLTIVRVTMHRFAGLSYLCSRVIPRSAEYATCCEILLVGLRNLFVKSKFSLYTILYKAYFLGKSKEAGATHFFVTSDFCINRVHYRQVLLY